MIKIPHFGRFCLVAATSSAALLAGAGGVQAAGLSCTGLPAVGGVTSNPISCALNCSGGGTLASAVALKPRTTNRLTITIKGTCVASTDDLPGGITLQGASASATLQAPKATTDPVLGISGTGVELDKLTISGGVYALRGHPGAAFTGTDLVVEKASSADVFLNHAVATLSTSTVENSAGDGIDVNYGSAVFLNGGVAQGNAGTGVSSAFDGSADVYGGAVVQNNGAAGIGASSAGAVVVSAGTVKGNATGSTGLAGVNVSGGHVVVEGSGTSVSGNGVNGITIYDGGSAIVEDDAVIENNSGNGLLVIQGGFAKVRQGAIVEGNTANGVYVENGNIQFGDTAGPGQATIQNNRANGIFLRTNSVAGFDNAANKITANTGWGILCTGSPSNPLIFGTIGTVSGNTAGQISCKVSP